MTQENIRRWLAGGEDHGWSQLPPASHEMVDKVIDVEVLHAHYGLLKISYLGCTHRHYKSRLYSWSMQSAIQLDPSAPRPAPYEESDDRALGVGANPMKVAPKPGSRYF